jgi:hypothetical protein
MKNLLSKTINLQTIKTKKIMNIKQLKIENLKKQLTENDQLSANIIRENGDIKAEIATLQQAMIEKESVQFVNLNKHVVCFIINDVVTEFPAAEKPMLVNIKTETVNYINSLPVVTTSFGNLTSVPEKIEGTIYIANMLTLARVKIEYPERNDFLAMDSGRSAVRNDKGHIEYCTQLIK